MVAHLLHYKSSHAVISVIIHIEEYPLQNESRATAGSSRRHLAQVYELRAQVFQVTKSQGLRYSLASRSQGLAIVIFIWSHGLAVVFPKAEGFPECIVSQPHLLGSRPRRVCIVVVADLWCIE